MPTKQPHEITIANTAFNALETFEEGNRPIADYERRVYNTHTERWRYAPLAKPMVVLGLLVFGNNRPSRQDIEDAARVYWNGWKTA